MTLTLSEELYQRAQEAARAEGQTVDEFVGEAILRAVSRQCPPLTTRNGLPTMQVDQLAPRIDPEKVRQLLQEEGV